MTMQNKFIKRLIIGVCTVLISATIAMAKDEPYLGNRVSTAESLDFEKESITLIFIFNRCYQAFTHVSAVLNGDSKTIYDPGGSWMKPGPLPERGFFDDVSIEDVADFINYHIHPNHMLLKYPIHLSKDEMDYIYKFRENAPLEEPGICALRVSALIKEIPRFNNIEISLFPRDIFNFMNREIGHKFEIILDSSSSDSEKLFSSSKWNDFLANVYGEKFSWMNINCID